MEQVYGDVTEIGELMGLSQEAMNTDNEAVDPTFDLEASLVSDTDFMTESFCENWVLQLEIRFLWHCFCLFNWLSILIVGKQGCRGCWCHGRYKIENFKHSIKFIALFVSELHLRQG